MPDYLIIFTSGSPAANSPSRLLPSRSQIPYFRSLFPLSRSPARSYPHTEHNRHAACQRNLGDSFRNLAAHIIIMACASTNNCTHADHRIILSALRHLRRNQWNLKSTWNPRNIYILLRDIVTAQASTTRPTTSSKAKTPSRWPTASPPSRSPSRWPWASRWCWACPCRRGIGGRANKL